MRHHPTARAAAAALGVVLLTLAGCGGTVTAGPMPSGPGASLTVSTSGSAAHRLSVRPVATFTLPTADPARLTLLRHGIAYVAATPSGRPTVEVLRRGDRRPTRIFTGTRAAVVEALVADAHHVVWAVVVHGRPYAARRAPWMIYAYGTRTGRTSRVASSASGTSGPSVLAAPPVIGGDRIAWGQSAGPATRATELHVADLRGGRPRRVRAGVHADQLALAGDSLIYDGAAQDHASRSRGGHDLFALDLRTGHTRRLTHLGTVDEPVSAGRWLAWESGSWDPGRAIGVLRPGGRMLTLSDRLQGDLGIGRGFVAYDGRNGLDATLLASGAEPVNVASHWQQSCPRCGFSVRGSRLAWGASAHGRTTVTVDAVGSE